MHYINKGDDLKYAVVRFRHLNYINYDMIMFMA